MLSGTATPESFAHRAPSMTAFDVAAAELPGSEVLQAYFEMSYASRLPVLPAGLHPTSPPLLGIMSWRCPESPWGPFSMAQTWVQCRSGVRQRGFVTGTVVTTEEASSALASGWGFPSQVGEVKLRRYFDAVELNVSAGGKEILELLCVDPDPLGTGDVAYPSMMNIADTPRGLRLIQVEAAYESLRVERVRPRIHNFDAAGWGEPILDPYHPVSASIALANVTLRAIRFVCKPDVIAYEGTESVN